MKIISEKTGKEYNSVELCLADEKAYDERIAQEKAKKEAEAKALAVKKETAIAERKEAASKVEEKRQALIAAQKAYQEEVADRDVRRLIDNSTRHQAHRKDDKAE